MGERDFPDPVPGTTPVPERILQIDLLKAFAIFSVIVMHTFPIATIIAVGGPYYLWNAVPLFILIAGFTAAYGFRKRGATTLRQCYDPGLVARRYVRLGAPYLLYWVLGVILLVTVLGVSLDARGLVVNLASGGSGWGSYFIPIILESVLVVPLLYVAALRHPDLMVVTALAVNIAFELLVVLTGSTAISSFIYFRYLFAGALGVWLVTTARRRRPAILLGGIASLGYLTLVGYTTVFPQGSIFYQYDGALQFPAFLWTLVLAVAGLAWLPKAATSRITRSLAAAGKASWHIFMVQMLFFLFPAEYVYGFLNTFFLRVVLEPVFFAFPQALDPALQIVGVACNLAICCVLGYGWFSSEKRVAGAFRRRIHPA
ncbi:MAG TPA: acyltransferase [Methanomicrobiales archaeon]|nr:acyltransferase [Methanomicrobiales archaeon]